MALAWVDCRLIDGFTPLSTAAIGLAQTLGYVYFFFTVSTWGFLRVMAGGNGSYSDFYIYKRMKSGRKKGCIRI